MRAWGHWDIGEGDMGTGEGTLGIWGDVGTGGGDTGEDRGDMWGHGVGDRDRDGDMG